MNIFKTLLSIAVLSLFSLSSKATGTISVEACILDHVKNTDCYKVETTVYYTDENGKILVARGNQWIGKDCEKNGHLPIKADPNCPAVHHQDMEILTVEGSPHCLSDYLNDPKILDAYVATTKALYSSAISATANKGITSAGSGLSFYPNPATSYIMVTAKFEDAVETKFVYIYDVSGKQVSVMQLISSKFTVSLKDFKSGNYLIVVKADGKILDSKKLVIQ